MAKIRTGIEIPIIPEDFIDSEDVRSLAMLESILERAYRCVRDGIDKTKGGITETDFHRYVNLILPDSTSKSH